MSSERQTLERIFEQSDVGLFETSDAGEVRRANPALARILGYDSVEDLQKGLTDARDVYFNPGDRERLSQILERDGEIKQFVHMLRRRDGDAVWVSETCRRIREPDGTILYVGSMADVTELVDAKEAARKAEDHYRDIYENATVGIYRTRPDGHPVSANSALLKLLGFEDEETWKQNFHATRFYTDPRRRQTFVRDLLESGKVTGFESEIFVRGDKNHGTRWISESGRVIRSESGQAAYFEGTIEDITARREADSLRRKAHEADQANRLKSDFLAAMSHELRTPLNGVIGAAHALNRDARRDKERELSNLIVKSGEGLLAILNDILDLAKVEAGRLELEIEPFEPKRLVEEALVHWRPMVSEGSVELGIELDDDLPPLLRGDGRRIRQILWNYLSNALKFTDQGSITLRVKARPDGGCARLRFEVADTGSGMPEMQCDQVFDKFHQVRDSSRQSGGTGLGLAICREFAQLMGGSVGCSSEPGKGSVFWFEAPFQYCRNRCQNGSEDQAGEPYDLSGVRVLAAEDNPINQRVLGAILENYGCAPDFAFNGAEALQMIESKSYDVVLMDIQMPEMDGVEAVKRLRNLTGRASRLPVIALTANAMRGDREAYLEAGMDDFVAKPIEPDTLLAAISRAKARDLDSESARVA